MNERVTRNVGNCEVTIVFKGRNENLKDSVLWVMTENYQSRLSESKKRRKKKSASEKRASQAEK